MLPKLDSHRNHEDIPDKVSWSASRPTLDGDCRAPSVGVELVDHELSPHALGVSVQMPLLLVHEGLFVDHVPALPVFDDLHLAVGKLRGYRHRQVLSCVQRDQYIQLNLVFCARCGSIPNSNKLQGRPKTTLPIVYNRNLTMIQQSIRLHTSTDLVEITDLAQDMKRWHHRSRKLPKYHRRRTGTRHCHKSSNMSPEKTPAWTNP